MRSKGWGIRKVGAPFPYFLFLVSYYLFPLRPCSFASFARNQTPNTKRQTSSHPFSVNHFAKIM
jgi:hypothetical protein